MGTQTTGQLAIDETLVDNVELEKQLEARAALVLERRALNATFKEADDAVRGGIAQLEIPPDGAIRIGRFRITKTTTAPRHVEFDTDGGERIRIDDDEEE
jgi:hypothetical protein